MDKERKNFFEENEFFKDEENTFEDNESYNMNNNEMTQEEIQEFIKTLLGFYLRFWNLHWAAKTNNKHVRLDEIRNELEDYIDKVAESIQGNTSQFEDSLVDQMNDLPTDLQAYELLESLEKYIIDFENNYCQNDNWKGTSNINNTFLEFISKYKYLLRLSENN